MKVLVLNPPCHRRYSRSSRSPAAIKCGAIYYPLWLAYVTGVLGQDGFEASPVDARPSGLGLSTVISLAEEHWARLVVIDTRTPGTHNDVEVAAVIKLRPPEAFELLFSPHVTALPEESLEMDPAVDAVARSEYDYTVRDVASELAGGRDPGEVLDLRYRGGDGSLVSTPPRPLLEDLDALPSASQVYRRHLRVEDCFYSITRHPDDHRPPLSATKRGRRGR